jgi:hypothetical protein
MTKIAIIGAGLSGLSLARMLQERAEVTLFEKSRGLSGRMATRRAEPYSFDHGAQYFTARTPAFQHFIQPLIEAGVVERWHARYVKFDGEQVVERKNWMDDEPRYVFVPGMNRIGQHCSQGLNIQLNTRINSLERHGTWQLTDDEGRHYPGFDWVISTAPAPQAVALLPEIFHYHADISAIEMQPCLSLMLGFERDLDLAFDAAHVINADVSWIAVNSHKPGRADRFTLVVHSSEQYAATHIDDDREAVMQHLIAETSRIIGRDIGRAVDFKTVHGWRFANNATRTAQSAVFIDDKHQLAACGDWCLGGRVEGAFTSALHLANAMQGRTREF